MPRPSCTRVTAFLTTLFATPCVAQTTPDAWRVAAPIIDVPYNTDTASPLPSIAQALGATQSFYELSHYALQEIFKDNKRATAISIVAFDIVSSWLPLGNSWLHEEWHRAVMSHNGFSSHNGIYDFEFSDVIKVTDVTDEQLTRLKAESPADFVRMSSAGLEAQTVLTGELERSAFFFRTPVWIQPIILLNTLNTVGYLHTCAGTEANTITADANAVDGSDVAARDFTGLDCNAWVYDLFRPTEPYDVRGTHPSGVGIDRYRDYDDLTDEERAYLRHQRNLSLLNFVDPFLFGREYFRYHDLQWNAALRHTLTPFGYALGSDFFVRHTDQRWHGTLNVYSNDELTTAGIDVTCRDMPLVWFGMPLRIAPRFALWQQPDELLFRSGHAKTGGLLGLRVAAERQRRWQPYLEVETKSAGWVMGNVDLDAATSFRVGVEFFPNRP